MEDDLIWLEENAFECLFEINGHRASFTPIADEIRDRNIDDDEWTPPEAKAEALATGRLIIAHVYPCGSVSSYSLSGVSLAAVAHRARMLCEEEQLRWQHNGMVPLHKR